jgi:hypothetical protein
MFIAPKCGANHLAYRQNVIAELPGLHLVAPLADSQYAIVTRERAL